MIDDPKLERLLGVVRSTARDKDAATHTFEQAKGELPTLESNAQHMANEYEAALDELAKHLKSS